VVAQRAALISSPVPEAIGTAAAMPTIFISHSCKDNEQAPPATLSPQDAAARAGRLAFSRKLRDALVTALKKNQRYKVFLDDSAAARPRIFQSVRPNFAEKLRDYLWRAIRVTCPPTARGRGSGRSLAHHPRRAPDNHPSHPQR
jgi:hypothetical protein